MRRALFAATVNVITLALCGCPGGMNETKQDRGGSVTRDKGPPADSGGQEGGAVTDSGKQDSGKCPSAPTCNWCNGAAVKDAKGCITAFTCDNGADPCKTQPCTQTSCPTGQYCDQKKLCRSKKDAGVPDTGKPPPLCLNSNCKATPGKSCSCDWSCTDGTKYKATCAGTSGGYSCTCTTDGVKSGTCKLTATCYQSYVAKCCGFSMQ